MRANVNASAPLASHHHIRIVAPATGTDEPLMPIENRLSGPYRRAISAGEAICDGSVRSFAAGSALVPPSAARSDAVAGST